MFVEDDLRCLIIDLRAVQGVISRWGIEEIDVRLVGKDYQNTTLYSGDVAYDLVHYPFCVASRIQADYTEEKIRAVAKDLLDQYSNQFEQAKTG